MQSRHLSFAQKDVSKITGTPEPFVRLAKSRKQLGDLGKGGVYTLADLLSVKLIYRLSRHGFAIADCYKATLGNASDFLSDIQATECSDLSTLVVKHQSLALTGQWANDKALFGRFYFRQDAIPTTDFTFVFPAAAFAEVLEEAELEIQIQELRYRKAALDKKKAERV